MLFSKTTVAAAVATAVSTTAAFADPIHVKGSSTVFPFAMMSADAFTENHDGFDYPNVESGGSSAGLKAFCQGVGADSVDIATASRKIKAKEIKACADSGVTDIIEVVIGFDGLVFAGDKKGPDYSFTPADWYAALGARVLIDGALVENTAMQWDEVNANLPAHAIRTFIPAAKHGTREVFDQKMLIKGCKATGAYDAFLAENGGDAKAASKSCMVIRSDKAVTELEVFGSETVDMIRGTKGSIGLLGLAFYEANNSDLKAATINDVYPSADSIATGEYPVSRPLYMYIKKANIGVTPGIKEYVQTILSDEMTGPGGFLTLFGLVSNPEVDAVRATVTNEVTMSASS